MGQRAADSYPGRPAIVPVAMPIALECQALVEAAVPVTASRYEARLPRLQPVPRSSARPATRTRRCSAKVREMPHLKDHQRVGLHPTLTASRGRTESAGDRFD